jgi:hypothetical protein
MKSILISALVFGLAIPLIIAILSSFKNTDITSQANICNKEQVFRASDQSCYDLQGE